MLVSFSEVRKAFGAFEVLRSVSFQVDRGQKLGLIGPNGSGKTTLLDLIDTPAEIDGGQLHRAAGLRTGRIAQHQAFNAGTVLQEALASFSHLRAIEDRLRDLEARMEGDHDAALLGDYARLQHEMEHGGGYTYRARTEAALFGLGFRPGQFGQAPASLSGGEKNRLALACLLLAEVDILLLDEPTNHLDIRSIDWLERYLRDTPRAILLVSHDRVFLDRVVGGILELDRGRLREYPGNYSAYVRQREERRKSEERAWIQQQEWIRDTEEYIRRNIAGQKTRQAQSRRRALTRLERVERPFGQAPPVRFRFSHSGRSGRYPLRTRDLAIGYDADRPVVAGVSLEIESGDRCAILGANGSGKTTLLATLAGRRPPLGGEVERTERPIGYYDQELEQLHPNATVFGELRAVAPQASDGELRGFLAGFLFRADTIGKRISDLSGGEKSRLALALLIYQAPALLALDEPTNHLDIPARESLEAALAEYPGTLLFVTHDRRLVERVATRVLYLESGRALPFDSFGALEAHLAAEREQAPPPTPARGATGPSSQDSRSGSDSPSGLSKNRRDRVEREIRRVESSIREAEEDLGGMEGLFQSPPPDFDWETTHRRYDRVKTETESLYQRLAELLETIEGVRD
jgi:ATP-binding cassette subfamily F protein 3